MEDKRLIHLKNLMTIAFADGVLDPMEKEFIIEKASMLGIEEKELNDMFKEALNLKQRIVHTTVRKEEQMADAILMGKTLGFSRIYVDEIIQKSFKYWGKPTEKS